MTMIRLNRGLVVAVAMASLAANADAGGKAPKAAKPYPVLENRYIKQFAGPTVSCGACFGFYRTQWRSWADACNEPQPVDPGPKEYAPVIPVPPDPMKKDDGKEPEKKDPEKKEPPKADEPKKEPEKKELPKKEPEKKKTDKKQNSSVHVPTISIPEVLPSIEVKPVPLALPKAADKPMPVSNFEIVLPAAPQSPPGLVKPMESLPPTVLVPVPSK